MKLLKLSLLVLFSLLTADIYCQYYGQKDVTYEFGVGLGAMNAITDLGGASNDRTTYINEIQSRNWNFSPSIYVGAMYKDFLGIRLQGTIGTVEAADSTIKGTSGNLISKFERNLSFKSKIAEVALLGEFYPLTLLNFELFPYLSPYIVGGIGYFKFNPQAEYRGQWVDLQPLRLEGQGFDEYPDRKVYNLSAANLAFGLGVRYEISNFLNLKVEYVHRKLTTDYLDDASTKTYINPALFSKYLSPPQAALARALYNRSTNGRIPIFRGHENEEDAYMTLSVRLGISLGRDEYGERARNRQLKCFFKF